VCRLRLRTSLYDIMRPSVQAENKSLATYIKYACILYECSCVNVCVHGWIS